MPYNNCLRVFEAQIFLVNGALLILRKAKERIKTQGAWRKGETRNFTACMTPFPSEKQDEGGAYKCNMDHDL